MEKGKNPNATILLAKGTKIEGTLKANANIRLEGEIEGQVECTQKLVIGPGARITGDISCGELDSQGAIHGDVNSQKGIRLSAEAQLHGNVECHNIQIDGGAVFNGQCSMKKSEV